MRVYLPTGEATQLRQDDVISIRHQKDDFLPVARVFRENQQLLIGVGAEKRTNYSVLLADKKEKWTVEYIKDKLKISEGIEVLKSSNDSVHQFRVVGS